MRTFLSKNLVTLGVNKKDVHKSALWAIISFPISILFIGLLVHGGGSSVIIYRPGFFVMQLFGWTSTIALFPAQYIGYFILIFTIRIIAKLGILKIQKAISWVAKKLPNLSTKLKIKSNVHKSALWALMAIPITAGIFYGWEVGESGLLLLAPLFPGIIAVAFLVDSEGWPSWVLVVMSISAQYLAYFLYAFILIKLQEKRTKNRATERSENEPGPYLERPE